MSEVLEQAAFPLTLDLGDNGGAPRFESAQDIHAWFQTEINSFGWLSEASQAETALAPAVDHWRRFAKPVNQKVIELTTTTDPEQLQQRVKNFAAEVTAAYTNRLVLHSTGAQGAFVLSLRQNHALVAAGAWVTLLNLSVTFQNSRAIAGAAEAVVFRRLLAGDLGAEPKKQIATAQKNWSAIAQRTQREADVILRDLSALLAKAKSDWSLTSAEIQGSMGAADEAMSKLAQEGQERVTKALDDSKVLLEDFQRTISNAIALQAPVTFWAEKERRHGWGAGVFGALVLIAGAGGTYFLYTYGLSMLAQWGEIIGKSGKQVTFADVPLTLVSMFLFGVLLFVWVERILVRIFLSHVHLRTEAAERVVMAKTYLSLLKEGSGPKEEDRSLILAALFRPSVTGVVTDDAAPAFWDSILRDKGRHP